MLVKRCMTLMGFWSKVLLVWSAVTQFGELFMFSVDYLGKTCPRNKTTQILSFANNLSWIEYQQLLCLQTMILMHFSPFHQSRKYHLTTPETLEDIFLGIPVFSIFPFNNKTAFAWWIHWLKRADEHMDLCRFILMSRLKSGSELNILSSCTASL